MAGQHYEIPTVNVQESLFSFEILSQSSQGAIEDGLLDLVINGGHDPDGMGDDFTWGE